METAIDCSHKAGLRTATFFQLSHRCHLANSSIFVTQMDYILSSVQLQLVQVQYDFAMPIGLDHRCVHCTMKIPFRKKRFRKQFGFKCWRPILDEHGHPTSYQQHICEMIASSSTSTASDLENILLRAGVKHGTSTRQRIAFSPSEHLQQLRCTQASSGTTFAERFEFADPTNPSARIETVEIKSIKCLLG